MKIRSTAGRALILLLVWFATMAWAQVPAVNSGPKFEAASVKPTDPNARTQPGMGVTINPGGRLLIHGVSLKTLIAIAYNLSYWQIDGGDSWMAKETYEIEAVPPAAAGPTISLSHTWFSIHDERLRAMLQVLLADRFKLQIHQEAKPGTVYLLQRSSKQLRLKPVDQAGGTVGYAGGSWTLDADMSQFSWFASSMVLHAPVEDQTGLQGGFYFRQSSADLNPQYSGPGITASFIGFLSEAGLKLVRSNGLVETIKIDHAEKPTPD
jgi:uncharacterized protein (TIGR03435 family)